MYLSNFIQKLKEVRINRTWNILKKKNDIFLRFTIFHHLSFAKLWKNRQKIFKRNLYNSFVTILQSSTKNNIIPFFIINPLTTMLIQFQHVHKIYHIKWNDIYILKILIEKIKASPVKFPAKSLFQCCNDASFQSALEETPRPDRSALNPRVLFAATLYRKREGSWCNVSTRCSPRATIPLSASFFIRITNNRSRVCFLIRPNKTIDHPSRSSSLFLPPSSRLQCLQVDEVGEKSSPSSSSSFQPSSRTSSTAHHPRFFSSFLLSPSSSPSLLHWERCSTFVPF